MTTPQTCSICNGTGTAADFSGKEVKCRNCSGTGTIVEEKSPPPAVPNEEQKPPSGNK
jgi:DnaJ-class molecular chaperone